VGSEEWGTPLSAGSKVEEPRRLAAALKDYARSIGFHLVGITSPDPFAEAELDIARWLNDGHNGEMAWMNEARMRLACRPDELLPGARSLVVVGVSYRTVEPHAAPTSNAQPSPAVDAAPPPPARVARYAWGSDYHDVLTSRLKALAAFLAERSDGVCRSRVFVDSGPLVERDAAVRAGLGFRGKNTNLLTVIGSYVFLGALLTTVELEPDQSMVKSCGTCTLCLDACPTNALDEPYHLQAEKCIAYLTIEHRGPIPEDLRPRMGDWVFGCDICQEVCPYNASWKNTPTSWPEFEPRPLPDLAGLLALDDEGFRTTFKGSPVKRTKRRGLARNAAIALGNSADRAAEPALLQAAQRDPEPMVREAAEWALTRLRAKSPTGGGSAASS
jgi:epoxyqueuosine reductase